MDEVSKEARKRLLDRRKAIEALIAEVDKDEAQLQGAAHPDLLDHAAHRSPIEVLESIRGAQQHELAELEAALQRIESGSYGTCQTCGGAVGRQRLRAIPEARFCIECVSTRSRRAVAS
ncbi:MAG TPA: TraR/DksA family transcriptional regulator [Myxococcales bacterium]|nr:TraR/DksA family transcriptional regulator [Myxococcales bacterium]